MLTDIGIRAWHKVAYWIAVSIIPVSCIGLFHKVFIVIDDPAGSFFLSCASLFMMAVGFMLTWYYVSNFARYQSLCRLLAFGTDAIMVSAEKISALNVLKAADSAVNRTALREDGLLELLGFAIPFAILSIEIGVIMLYMNSSSLLLLVTSYVLLAIAIKLVDKMVKIYDVMRIRNTFGKFMKSAVSAAEGIQYYNASELVGRRFAEDAVACFSDTNIATIKATWKAFAIACVPFVFMCAAYIWNARCVTDGFFNFNLDGIEIQFFSCMFCFTMFIVSIFRCIRIRRLELDDLSHDKLDTEEYDAGTRSLDDANLFITFHGVFFQDPTEVSDHPILSDLTFSVLPGEFIAITGENSGAGQYIFALLLKYCSPQSGKIYISGTRADSISTKSIRALVGVFKEDFGIIPGTLRDNVMMATSNSDEVMIALEKTGLGDMCEDETFDADGDLIASQDTLLRLQFARISILNPRVVLVTTPRKFYSQSTEDLFYEIVEHMSKRRTIIMITDNPKVFIYADKILYMSNDGSIFGSHADLAQNVGYQNYISRYKRKTDE
ncbi:MAG: ABC transporter ATP-binding protein/permease [Holosporales bacterium]|jgi:ABC-type multidrug transport system fused ATPase/permease subunit|nr:ABC transporter ATP-binding protein/permease [Holosporales bacterium]